MGKTSIFACLAQQLTADRNNKLLVGFARSRGQSADLLLRAIIDLYQNWLSDSSYLQQARLVWKQQKKNLLPAITKVFSRLFEEIPFGKSVGSAIAETLNGLVEVNKKTLGPESVVLPPLQYDLARELIKSVFQISGCRVVLFLDQLNESPNLRFEVNTFGEALRDTDWPPCHMFLALQEDVSSDMELVTKLVKSRQGVAEIYPLREMNLRDDDEKRRLLFYVWNAVPALVEVDPETILRLVGGYPGVIYQWKGSRNSIASIDDAERIASNAQNYRFGEIESLVPNLVGDQRKIAIRIAILPILANGDAWQELQHVVKNGITNEAVDDLRLSRVLEDANPPSYGHAKRWEAARTQFLQHRPAAVRDECQIVIAGLADSLSARALSFGYAVIALGNLYKIASEQHLAPLQIALCQCAMSLLGQHDITDDALIGAAKHAGLTDGAKYLISAALVEAQGDAYREKDLPRCELLLNILRGLAGVDPIAPTTRTYLAMGLHNSLITARALHNFSRRDALLLELRALAQGDPTDSFVAAPLATAVLDTLISAIEDRVRRDELLQELRALSQSNPSNGYFDGWLADGLQRTLSIVELQFTPHRRDNLLDELRSLVRTYPAEPRIREAYAKSLCSSFKDSRLLDDMRNRGLMDKELENLKSGGSYLLTPGLAISEEAIAAFSAAFAEDFIARGNALFDELRVLNRCFPNATEVGTALAVGLMFSLNEALTRKDMEQSDLLLDELRELARSQGRNSEVILRLCRGIVNLSVSAKVARGWTWYKARLDELFALACAEPPAARTRVLELLVIAQYNVLSDTRVAIPRPEVLVEEECMRILMESIPSENSFPEELRKDIARMLNATRSEAVFREPIKKASLMQRLNAILRRKHV